MGIRVSPDRPALLPGGLVFLLLLLLLLLAHPAQPVRRPPPVVLGDNNRIPVIESLKIREQQRTAVSTSWMLPYNYTWSSEKVLVYTPTVNYTLRDYHKFFQDIGFEDGWLMRQDTEGLVDAMMPPGVRLHCLYGTGVPTPDSFYYDSFPDRDPKIYFGDGDGTVNLQSALQCRAWHNRQEQQVSLQELPGSEHLEMLANATTLAYLKRLLLGL
uniref:Phospholipase A2 group XV n=1 Tax=Microcebus murinus TaxID=30608 RepID=A0A8C5XS85_MICMU